MSPVGRFGAYIAGNHPMGSMGLVGTRIAEALGGETFSQIEDAVKYDTVLTVVVEDIPGLMALKGQGNFKRFIGLLGGNREESTDAQFMRLLAYLDQGMESFICHSQHSYDLVTADVRRLMSYPTAKRWLERIHLIWWAVDEFPWSTNKDPLKWVVPFVRVNEIQKGVKRHHEVTTQMQLIAAQRGHPVETTFIYDANFTASNTKGVTTASYKMVPKGPREEYAKVIAPIGGFLSTSKFESFGIYYIELLMSGAVGVFEDYPWIRKLLPGYPLTVGKEDLVSACVSAVEDFPRWRERIKKETLPFIRERYNFKRFNDELYKVVGGGDPHQ